MESAKQIYICEILNYFLSINSTEQNPHGCCDGYMWDSAVGNCISMLITLTNFFILIDGYKMF